MGTPRRIRIGLVLALLAFFSLNLLPPSPTFAQDEEGASEPPATQEEPAPPADKTPPSIGQPLDIVVAAEDATGAWVVYVVPEAIDERDGAVPVACAPEPGLRFPLGTTKVKCAAQDAAENRSTVSFLVTVTDQTPPVIDAVGDIVADATDASGAAVNFPVPGAWDNVDGAVAIGCDFASGAIFPVGTTVVTCWAQDNANNQANPVSFAVTVNALPEPVPTDPPTEEPTEEPSQVPTETPTEEPTETPTTEPTVVSTEVPTTEPTKTPKPTKTPTEQPSETPTDGPTPTRPSTTPSEPTQAPTPTDVPTPPATGPTPIPTPEGPAALELPPMPPDGFVLVTDGGPVGLLASVWGNDEYPISQEFGHTDFSVTHPGWYAYGLGYGLDGYEHTGLDVGMPAGTPLYSPVEGTVAIAGGTPYFTFYGNGQPGVGELLIRTADGDEVVLGHMGRIAVEEGDRVKIGQFVGLSGGENGDHLHLEVRELQPLGGYRIVDPRKSFVVKALDAAAKERDEDGQPRYRTLALALEREGAVGEATNAKYAEITVRRVNCAVDEAGSAAAACGDAVLAGASFTVYNPSNHGTTRVTDPDGLTRFGPRAGENVVEKALGADDFAGAYVSCVAQSDGRVLFEGAIAEPSIALETEPGEVIVCDWYNLAAGTTVD